MGKFSGKEGHVTVGGTTLDITAWEANETIEETDTTDTGSAGLMETEDGFKDLRGSMDFHYNTNQLPASAPNVSVGTSITTLVFYRDATSPAISVTVARITALSIRLEAKGGVTVRCDWKQAGSWTIATS